MSEETLAESLKLAVQYQQENRLAQAQQIYQEILAQQPQNGDALYGLGSLAQKTGDFPRAEQLFRDALTFQPQSLKTWFSLGNLYYAQTKLPEAEECYLKVIEIQPNLVSVYNNLGYVLQQQGKLPEAIASYQTALDIEPNCVEAELNLATVLHSQGKLTAEKQAYYAAKNNDLGVTRKLAGDYQTAVAYYQQAIALQPDLTIAHYNLGVALDLKDAPEEARTCYQTVLNLSNKATSIYSQVAAQRLQKIEQLSQSPRESNIPRKLNKLKVAFVCQPWVITDLRQPMDSISIITCELAHRLAGGCDVTIYGAGSQDGEDYDQGVVYRYISVSEDNQLLAELEQSPSSTPLIASDDFYQKYINTVAHEIRDQEFDLVHIHNLSQFIPVVRAVNPNLKIVLHMHCDWLNNLDYLMLSKRLQYADLIISPSQYITNAIQQRFTQYSSRCQTLFNGVNLHRYLNGYINQPSQMSDHKSNHNKSVKRLLFVGRVSPEKGSHILLDAFQEVLKQRSDVELTLVGPIGVINSQFLVSLSDDPKLQALLPFHAAGGSGWINYLKASLSELNSQQETKQVNKVFLPGAVSPDRLAQYYDQADIFIFPSVCYEAFGMPIAEAMVAGLPVIATRAGAFPELVQEGKSGILVDQSDVNDLTEAILRLLDDQQLRRSMGQAGRKRAVELFSFDTVADELLQQYQEHRDI